MTLTARTWQTIRLFLIACMAMTLSMVAVAGLPIIIGGLLDISLPVNLILILSLVVTGQVAGYAAAVDHKAIMEGQPIATGFKLRQLPWLFLLAVILQVLGTVIATFLGTSTGGAIEGAGFASKLFIIGLMFPLGEEYFFRQVLWEKWKWRPLIKGLGIALLFAVVHIPAWGVPAAIGLLPLSLILSYLRHKTGTIVACSFVHIFFNCIAVFVEALT